ncbi:unnamed protein product [Rotaria sp. Silwood2]|nr:unnamed protein product [Rotaria sp. Silwood2]
MAANKFCSVCILRRVICSIHPQLHNIYNLPGAPSYATAESFGQSIEELSAVFTFGRQADPSEFLLFLFDHLISCLKTDEVVMNINSSVNPIQRIFGVNILSTITCKVCSNQSSVETWESILSLPITSHASLSGSLSAYFCTEELENGDLYECFHCRKQVSAKKTLKIVQQLPVVFFHFKRFHYDLMLQVTRKIHKFIMYPEILTLDSYFDEINTESNKENDKDGSYLYQLNSVVVHVGEYATSGHVFSYVLSPDGNWYKADDELVTPVKLDSVLGDENAYILCYSKVPKILTHVSDNDTLSSPTHSSSIVISSTPIHTCHDISEVNNSNHTVANLFEEESPISSNNCFEHEYNKDNLLSNEYLSILNEDDSSIQEYLSEHERSLSTLTDTSSIQLNENIQDAEIGNDFVAETPVLHQFHLRSLDLAKLQLIRAEKTKKKKNRLLEKMGLFNESDIPTNAKKIFISKQAKILKTTLHKPMCTEGASVYRMYQDKLQQRTAEQKKAQNYDNVGKSRCILSKIKSEGAMEYLLASDVDQGLFKLLEKFKAEVNPNGIIKGAIQFISKYPCQIIIYSESSIRLFDTLIKHKNTILSWDATGSVIKEKGLNRLLYYEMSITLPGVVNQDSIVPITIMISNSHALVDITHWLMLFKHSYSQVFAGRKIPQPRIVLSDRAQVFLIASLRVWNNENMNDFLNRAYRIVTGCGTKLDCDKTNIHACLSHVLLDSRKIINKCIPDEFRNFAMWCIALLINTSTWNEFINNWRLICFVFIELHLGQQHVNQEHREALIYKISKIKNDTNTTSVIKSSDTMPDDDANSFYCSNIYDFNESADEQGPEPIAKSIKKKITIDEEQNANATNSPFKFTINQIFSDILKSYGISMEEVRNKNSRGIFKWFKYLTTSFMPTLPICHILLFASVGDLSRHSRQMVYSFEAIIINNEEQRTTANSERRMGIVKRNQLEYPSISCVMLTDFYILGGEIHLRLDILLSILIPDMLSMIDEYWNMLLSYRTTSINSSNNDNTMIVDEQRFKPIEERWRQKSSKRGTGYYTKCPDEPIVTDLLSCLLASQVNLNQNLKLPVISPNWLNTAIGMLLSVGNNDTHHYSYTLSSTNSSVLISEISKFLEKWFNSTTSCRPTRINISSLNYEINQPLEQSSFILEKILIPLLPCHMVVNKIHVCNRCKSTTKVRSTITSIPINSSSTGLYLERDLFSYFSPTQSDLLCSICNIPTIRHMEVQQWPPILLLNITDSKKTIKYRKPPTMLSLSQFGSWIAIGCPSSSIYHLVCFNSIIKSGEDETMVRITKVKKSWQTNIHKRPLGEGDHLQRLYANSRKYQQLIESLSDYSFQLNFQSGNNIFCICFACINNSFSVGIVVFERILGSKTFNLVYAIAQCTLEKPSCLIDGIPQCTSIQEAISTIERHPLLNQLNSALMSDIKTRFSCSSCYEASDSLEEQSCQIFLFKSTISNQLVAYPIIFKNNDVNADQKYCTKCHCSAKNLVMNVHKQVFVKCPLYLIVSVFNYLVEIYKISSKILFIEWST